MSLYKPIKLILELYYMSKLSIFHPLEVVGRGSEIQLQVGEN